MLAVDEPAGTCTGTCSGGGTWTDGAGAAGGDPGVADGALAPPEAPAPLSPAATAAKAARVAAVPPAARVPPVPPAPRAARSAPQRAPAGRRGPSPARAAARTGFATAGPPRGRHASHPARAGAPRHVGLGQAWLPSAGWGRLGRPPTQGRGAAGARRRTAECALLGRIVAEWRLLSGDLRAAEMQLDDSEDQGEAWGEGGGDGDGAGGERINGERRLRLLHGLMLHRRMRARTSFSKWLTACRARRGGPPAAVAPVCAVDCYRGLGRDPITLLRQSLLNNTALYRML